MFLTLKETGLSFGQGEQRLKDRDHGAKAVSLLFIYSVCLAAAAVNLADSNEITHLAHARQLAYQQIMEILSAAGAHE
jgi:hypothetical protein